MSKTAAPSPLTAIAALLDAISDLSDDARAKVPGHVVRDAMDARRQLAFVQQQLEAAIEAAKSPDEYPYRVGRMQTACDMALAALEGRI